TQKSVEPKGITDSLGGSGSQPEFLWNDGSIVWIGRRDGSHGVKRLANWSDARIVGYTETPSFSPR
ncbi:MAG: hypothetical protein AAGA03_15545, partial [Planctomycetota bacterium]